MIGARLRLIRIAYSRAQGYVKDMSQAEFARLCEISPSALNNAETGDNRIGLDAAMAIRARTGVTLDFIFEGDRRLLPHAIAIEIDRLMRPNKGPRG